MDIILNAIINKIFQKYEVSPQIRDVNKNVLGIKGNEQSSISTMHTYQFTWSYRIELSSATI